MRVRYDEEADALYIKLREGEYHESDEIRDGSSLTTMLTETGVAPVSWTR